LTSTGAPSDETDASFTLAVPTPLLGADADAEGLLLLLELLPQPPATTTPRQRG
jgi:hypothetical protein